MPRWRRLFPSLQGYERSWLRGDLVVAGLTAWAVLVPVFDTLPGLFIGIGVSLLLLIYRASRPYVAIVGREPGGRYSDMDRHPDNQPHPMSSSALTRGYPSVEAAVEEALRGAPSPRSRRR